MTICHHHREVERLPFFGETTLKLPYFPMGSIGTTIETTSLHNAKYRLSSLLFEKSRYDHCNSLTLQYKVSAFLTSLREVSVRQRLTANCLEAILALLVPPYNNRPVPKAGTPRSPTLVHDRCRVRTLPRIFASQQDIGVHH